MTPILLLLGLMLILALLVLGYVLWPLLRPAPAVVDPSAEIARDVLRARRDELLAALSHLPADAPERQAALAEFAAQAQEELVPATVQAPARESKRSSLRARMGLGVAGLLLLAAPAAMYLIAGMPEAVSPIFVESQRPPASVEELVTRLQARLKEQPNDAEGWSLLGRSELARGNLGPALEALERANTLRPKDPATLADLADALAQRDGRRLDGRPIELIREALAIDPKYGKALALAGAWEVTQGNAPAAIALWGQLLEQLPAESEQARQIAGFVDDLKAGRRPGTGSGAANPSAAAPTTASGSAPAATGPNAAPGPAAIQGRVELSAQLKDRLNPKAALFIVARTLDAEGRPSGAPLAVIRTEAVQLPVDFVLDDAQAMSPASKLSAQPSDARIVVIARVSASGEAALRSGDLLGSSPPVKPGASQLRVLIDATAP